MRKQSTWIVTGQEPLVQVLLVNHRGTVLSRLPQRFTSLREAQAEAARRNERKARGA